MRWWMRSAFGELAQAAESLRLKKKEVSQRMRMVVALLLTLHQTMPGGECSYNDDANGGLVRSLTE